jgi:hypothetical protein
MSKKFILGTKINENTENNGKIIESMNSFNEYDFETSNLIDTFILFDCSNIKNFQFL